MQVFARCCSQCFALAGSLPFAVDFKGPGEVAKAVLVLMCLGVDGLLVGGEWSSGGVLHLMKAFIMPAESCARTAGS
jgi:hypothetical protein